MQQNTTITIVKEQQISMDGNMNPRAGSAGPPDTTTHSPESPERPPSHRSTGSDMVSFSFLFFVNIKTNYITIGDLGAMRVELRA